MNRRLSTLQSLLAIAAMCVCNAVLARAPLCPTPLPFDPTRAPAISPIAPKEGDEVIYWVVGPHLFEVDAATVTRSGNSISLIVYEEELGFIPGERARCRPISLGILPAGTYTITRTLYLRDVRTPGFRATPSLVEQAPPFVVRSALTPPVPLSRVSVVIVLCVLAVAGALALRRANRA